MHANAMARLFRLLTALATLVALAGQAAQAQEPSGEDVCEGEPHLDQAACMEQGCCDWDDGDCWSAVGSGPCGASGGPPACIESQFDSASSIVEIDSLVCGIGNATLDTSACDTNELADIQAERTEVCICTTQMGACFASAVCAPLYEALVGAESETEAEVAAQNCEANVECGAWKTCADALFGSSCWLPQVASHTEGITCCENPTSTCCDAAVIALICGSGHAALNTSMCDADELDDIEQAREDFDCAPTAE